MGFQSNATNLVTGDTNGVYDIFVRGRTSIDNNGDNYRNYAGGDCDDNDDTIYPWAPETKYDDIDQDCNGYDLTIDITKAEYQTYQDKLTVYATSSWDVSANLSLDGYGSMTYQGNTWKITVDPAGGNPGTVTVSGFEGAESATVTVK